MSFSDYFLHPKKTGYDIPKTLTYSIIFIIAIILIFKALKKLKIKVDKRLALSISPFVVFGGALRVLEDLGIVSSYFFVTPGIYLFVFLIVFSLILVGKFLENRKSIPYHKIVFLSGVILTSFILPFIPFKNFYGLFFLLIFYSPWPILFYFLKFWSLENRLVTLIQLFDATVTFTAIQFFGFGEQHVLPTFLIEIFSPISFIFFKLFTVVLVLILIDKFCEDEEFKSFLKLCIGILGGATGSRDFFDLISLVG